MDEFKQFIFDELDRLFEIEVAKAPWWCTICGEGGNYEGERPDSYWYPPKDHVCPPIDMGELRGIEPDLMILDEIRGELRDALDEAIIAEALEVDNGTH